MTSNRIAAPDREKVDSDDGQKVALPDYRLPWYFLRIENDN